MSIKVGSTVVTRVVAVSSNGTSVNVGTVLNSDGTVLWCKPFGFYMQYGSSIAYASVSRLLSDCSTPDSTNTVSASSGTIYWGDSILVYASAYNYNYVPTGTGIMTVSDSIAQLSNETVSIAVGTTYRSSIDSSPSITGSGSYTVSYNTNTNNVYIT